MCSCKVTDGQCCSGSIHQQDGRHSLPGAIQFSFRPMGLVHSSPHGGISPTPTWASKCKSGQGVAPSARFQRLETGSSSFPIDSTEMGPLRDRSVCITPNLPTQTVCQLEARSTSNSFRCLFNELAQHTGVCIPSIRPNRTMPTTDSAPECRTTNSGCPSLALTTVVPTASSVMHRSPSFVPNVTNTVNEGQSISPPSQPAIGWLETISKCYETANISESTRNILLAAWRKNTTSAYASAWNKWVSWCDPRKINPLSAPVGSILEFLKDQFEDGKAYRTLNVDRSTLSTLLPEIDSHRVGSHPLVSQLLKGIFHLRPPSPRYIFTWDVSKVLEFIKSLGSNENLNLKMLSFKLIVLLGLTAPDRSADLAKKDLRFRTFLPEGVSFKLPGLCKTSRPGHPPKISFHAAFAEDTRLCPVECLKAYEHATKDYRPKDKQQADPLFLSYIRPFRPVTASTLARWVRSLLQLAGIDTEIFSVHSLRGASTSAAFSQGVSISNILHMADWSQENTFRKFYYRPVFNTIPGVTGNLAPPGQIS